MATPDKAINYLSTVTYQKTLDNIENIEKTKKKFENQEKQKKILANHENSKETKNLPTLSVYLPDQKIFLVALIDSGANSNYIAEKVIQEYSIPVVKKTSQTSVSLADSSTAYNIVFETSPLFLKHQFLEEVNFDVLPKLSFDLVLGVKWLQRNSPAINWSDLSVSFPLRQDFTNNFPTLTNLTMSIPTVTTRIQLPLFPKMTPNFTNSLLLKSLFQEPLLLKLLLLKSLFQKPLFLKLLLLKSLFQKPLLSTFLLLKPLFLKPLLLKLLLLKFLPPKPLFPKLFQLNYIYSPDDYESLEVSAVPGFIIINTP